MRQYLQEDLAEDLVHGMCVGKFAHELGKELALDKKFCYELALGGVLHDVGKLRISPYVYGRQEDGMLVEELQYMRKHTYLGYKIIEQKGYSEIVRNMVLYHHENFDGTGYPARLKGTDIPLEARIIKVCDVFAALLENRPYRKAFDVNTAAQILIEEAKDFDMKILLAFQRVIGSEEIIEEIEGILRLDVKNLHIRFSGKNISHVEI